MIQFQVGRHGSSKEQMRLVRRDTKQMDRRLKQTRKLFAVIRDDVLIPSFEAKFRRGGAYGQPPWESISKASLRKRKKRKSHSDMNKPLIDTGHLFVTSLAKSRFSAKGNEMAYGSWPMRRWWAPVHDLGGSEIPARPWAQLTFRDKDRITKARNEWVEGIILDNWERGRRRSTWFASMR